MCFRNRVNLAKKNILSLFATTGSLYFLYREHLHFNILLTSQTQNT